MGQHMQEIDETYHPDGTMTARVQGTHRVCRVVPERNAAGQPTGRYVYVTQNGSKHGRRYNPARDYNAAIASAMKWANRPLRDNWNF